MIQIIVLVFILTDVLISNSVNSEVFNVCKQISFDIGVLQKSNRGSHMEKTMVTWLRNSNVIFSAEHL